MPLEDIEGAGKYLGSLNQSNPLSSDEKREGDNHIRGIKNCLRNTFPNVNAEVSATAAQLDSIADGPFLSLALGGVVTGLTAFEDELRVSFGAASDGVHLIGGSAGTGGFVKGETFAGAQAAMTYDGTTHTFRVAGQPRGYVGGVDVGVVTSPEGQAYECGFRNLPFGATLPNNGVPTLQDRGKQCIATGATAFIPLGVFPDGAVLRIFNDFGASMTLTPSGGLVLTLAGTATGGTRTLARNGIAEIWFRTSGVAFISGPGVT
jgi:hypothetical protein